MHRVSPWTQRFSSRELAEFGAVGLLALLWLSTMDQYLALRRAGLPVRALHYHDRANAVVDTGDASDGPIDVRITETFTIEEGQVKVSYACGRRRTSTLWQ